MSQKWVTMSQACLILGVSRRTLTRWIKQRKIESKLDGNRRLIQVSHTGTDVSQDKPKGETQEGRDVSDMSQALIDQLKSENEYLRQELKDTRERSDTIIMQLTRQLEQSQLMLEAHKEPFWRRWFRKK